MLCHGPLHTCFYFALSRATSHMFLLCFATHHSKHIFTDALSQQQMFAYALYISLQKGFCKLCQKTSRHVLAYALLQATINKIVLILFHWPFPASFCLCFVTDHHWKSFSYALPQATLNKFLPVLFHSPLQHIFPYALSLATNDKCLLMRV